MTLQELRRRAAHLSGFVGASADSQFEASIDYIINEVASRYAKLGRVPRTNEVLSGVTNTATITRAPQAPNGVISVFDLTNKRRLPVYGTFEADNVAPTRATASAGMPRMVEWDHVSAPTSLLVWPHASPPVDLRIYYAYMPPEMERDSDEAWDGQLPQYHELIAYGAALEYLRKRIGEDSAEKLSDQNPYGPLNPITTLEKVVARKEAEFLAATAATARELPTADPYGGWYAPGYRWADPRLPWD